MNFDLDFETRRQLGYRLIDEVNGFFSSLPDRRVQPPSAERKYPEHLNSLPQTCTEPRQVLEDVLHELIDNGFHIPSAHYLGMMNPTPTYMAFLAEALVAALNPQLANVARSQLASRIEAETVRWIGELIGWPQSFAGTFTTGGNEANFSALAMAMTARFPHLVEDGLSSIGGQPTLYASAESHHSLDKSAGLLGIGRKALRRIAVNDRFQIDVERLEAAIRADIAAGHRPFCVVATVGTTSSGAIDEIPRIAEICRRHNLWLHIDGAYGAAVLFSPRHRELIAGIEGADSVTFDPHKWLAMPFSAGIVFTQHADILRQTFSVPCPYLQKTTTEALPDNMSVSAQWSRRMNSLKLWMTLRVHGRQAYERLIDRQMELTRGFAEWAAQSGEFELAAPQVLPILNLRVKGWAGDPADLAAFHKAIIEDVNGDGQRWISSAVVRGQTVIRAMVISYLSDERHLAGLKAALLNALSRAGTKMTMAV
ncbi:MAG: aminotransferase class V-fold PLP-dependent enzyme [Acidobacteria bacterium]|nr:aminotransferase class V-fold PLP-dependent enzyme [Acidobacteriota bacterium]